MRPERTLWTLFTFGIVDTFFVRTTNNSIHHNYPVNIMLFQGFYDLHFYICVRANVYLSPKPFFQESNILNAVLGTFLDKQLIIIFLRCSYLNDGL